MRKRSSLKERGDVEVVMIQLRRFTFVICPRCRTEYELEDEIYEYVTCIPCNLTLMIDQKDGHNVDQDEDVPMQDNFGDESGENVIIGSDIDLE